MKNIFLRSVNSLLAILFLFTFIATPYFAFAATKGGAKPGDVFYAFDIFFEKADLVFTFNKEKRVQKIIANTEERLAEAGDAATEGKPDAVGKAMSGYQEGISSAIVEAKNINDKEKTKKLLSGISDNVLKNQGVLTAVYNAVPETSKEAVKKAIAINALEQEKATEEIVSIQADASSAQTDEVSKLQKETEKITVDQNQEKKTEKKNEIAPKSEKDKNASIVSSEPKQMQSNLVAISEEITPKPASVSSKISGRGGGGALIGVVTSGSRPVNQTTPATSATNNTPAIPATPTIPASSSWASSSSISSFSSSSSTYSSSSVSSSSSSIATSSSSSSVTTSSSSQSSSSSSSSVSSSSSGTSSFSSSSSIGSSSFVSSSTSSLFSSSSVVSSSSATPASVCYPSSCQLINNSSPQTAPRISGSNVIWQDSNGLYYINLVTKERRVIANFPVGVHEIDDNKVVYSMDSQIYLYDINTNVNAQITHISDGTGAGFPSVNGNYISWFKSSISGDHSVFLYNITSGETKQIIGAVSGGQTGSFAFPVVHNDKIVYGKINYNLSNTPDVYIYDISTNIATKIGVGNRPRIYGDYVLWYGSGASNPITLYQISTQAQKNVGEGGYARMQGDKVVYWSSIDRKLHVYSISSGQTISGFGNDRGDGGGWTDPDIYGNTVVFGGNTGIYYVTLPNNQ